MPEDADEHEHDRTETTNDDIPSPVNIEERRQLPPSHPRFPYALQVSDHSERSDTTVDVASKLLKHQYQYPTFGWAELGFHLPDQPTSDANPRLAEYIQEQNVPDGAWEAYCNQDRHHTDPIPIHGGHFRYFGLENTNYETGWVDGPGRIWQFIETVRDNYYEYGVDPESLPVRVVTTCSPSPEYDENYDQYCEIYFRDGKGTMEYLMWNSNELFYDEGPQSELIQKVLVAVANAYEQPGKFLSNWGGNATGLERVHDV